MLDSLKRGDQLHLLERENLERSESGVTFVLRNGLLIMFEDTKPVSDRLMLQFKLVDSRYVTLITA